MLIRNSYAKLNLLIIGKDNFGHWRNGILSSTPATEAPSPSNYPSNTLVLAGSRTKRPDILNHFKHYQAGWDITNKHYWAVSLKIHKFSLNSYIQISKFSSF